jgi:type I restriction enzyme M protein
MTDANIKKILDCYIKRSEIEHFSAFVDNKVIAEQAYNISIGTYVIQKDNREVIDIEKLNGRIAEIVKKQVKLRTEIDAIVVNLEGATK